MGKFSQPRANNTYHETDYAPKKKKKKGRAAALITLCIAALALVAASVVGVWYFVLGGTDDGLIVSNVTVAGMNLGGMTKEQASVAIHRATDLTYTSENMVIELPDCTMEFTPAESGAQLDVDAVVEAAYSYGRTGTRAEQEQVRAQALTGEHPIALLPYLNLNLDLIRSRLEEYGSSFNSIYAPSSVTVEGEMPELDVTLDTFDPEAEGQKLIIELGNPGRNVDFENLYNMVLDAYSYNEFLVVCEMTAEEKIPDIIDLEALHEEYFAEPVNAAMDLETFEVTPETYGYGFDLEEALLLMEEAVYGDTIEIQMGYIVPEVLGEELSGMLFRDVLASYETDHTNDKNRNINLTLACASINGVVLEPGETFDYNTTLGKRTAENGYKAANAYSAGMTVKELGGGICQVSSTLYYCTLIADLEIISRSPHSYVSSYMPMGMDAAVSWGGPEFRFKNNTNYPIRIEAEVSGGKVRIKLIGTDEKDYYVKMEYEVTNTVYPTTETVEIPADNNPNNYKDGEVISTPYTGYTVKTYKLKYDKETDALISREFDRTSTYKYRNKQIASIIKKEEPTTPPTEATTPPATEAPAPTDPPAPAPTDPPASDGGVSEG